MHPTDKCKVCDSCGKPIDVSKGRGALLVYTNNEQLLTAQDYCANCTLKILLPGMVRINPDELPGLTKRIPRKKNPNLNYNPVAEQDIP